MIIIELCAILIYLIITLFSITIQPINLILGISCTLIIPGYNLVNIFKPQYKVIQKIGYITILSLAIVNIFMFFTYFFLYDLIVLPEGTGFIFDSALLITSIQIINLILVAINECKKHKNKKKIDWNAHKVQNYFTHITTNRIFKNYNLRSLISYILFFSSLIFLCVSTTYSKVPNNDFIVNYNNYRSNFTFFLRVPLIFYLFLIISILSLTYIIFSAKNNLIILTCISIFLYCLWILPYLQIKNFFSADSKLLFDLYQSYLNFGMEPFRHYGLTKMLNRPWAPYRYSTSIFTTILLANATQININFVLWFIYPLCYVSIPFFFYSIFQRHSTNKVDNSKNLKFFVLTILAVLVPQFIKFAHSATTGVLGTYIFFILVLEFYFFTNEREFNKKQVFFIAFLFFFLSLTHTEECIYFLIFVFIYSAYQILATYNNINKNVKSEYKKLRKVTLIWASFLVLLLLIFYLIQEFFGWIPNYIDMIIPEDNFAHGFVFNLYSDSKFKFLVDLQNSFSLSYIFILLISLGIPLLYYIFYLFLSNFKKLIERINDFGKKICKIFHRIIIKVISKRFFSFLLLFIIFSSLFIVDWVFFPFLKEEGILILIELLSLLIFIINIFLFIFGIKNYRLKDNKQIYFLIAILSCSLIFSIFFIIGDIRLGIYVLVFRFSSIFIFFNLITIEDTFFKNFMKKNKIFKMVLVVLLLFIGVFYSLRTLSFG